MVAGVRVVRVNKVLRMKRMIQTVLHMKHVVNMALCMKHVVLEVRVDRVNMALCMKNVVIGVRVDRVKDETRTSTWIKIIETYGFQQR